MNNDTINIQYILTGFDRFGPRDLDPTLPVRLGRPTDRFWDTLTTVVKSEKNATIWKAMVEDGETLTTCQKNAGNDGKSCFFMEKLIEEKSFFKKKIILKKIDRCIFLNHSDELEVEPLNPVTFQVHFPATLTTDGTQRMEPNGWNLRKMTQKM